MLMEMKKTTASMEEGSNTKDDVFTSSRRLLTLRKRIDGLFFITLAFVAFSIALTIFMIINILVLSSQLIHSGAVACDVSNCSHMGVEAMEKGGSAVDAAIVTMLCMGLYSPQYSGIGGGGFMVVFNNAEDMIAFDFRERAPLAASRDMFEGKPRNASEKGGLSVAVPGELRGMEEAHKKYGRLPWADLFHPIIEAAENGIIVSSYLASLLQTNRVDLSKNTIYLEEFTRRDGTPLQSGDIMQRASLARALRIIQTKGADEYYKGEIAQEIVSYVQQHGGGIISEEDLESYAALNHSVISTEYKGYKLISAPLPSGGPTALYCFNILNNQPFNSTPTGWDYHRIIEAFKYTFAERMQFGDPLFVTEQNLTQLVAHLMEEETGRRVQAQFTDRTYKPSHYGVLKSPVSNHGTTHISVLDKQGMAVSVTTSVNLYFGSALILPTYGIVLNDDMDDFSSPHLTNYFDLPPTHNNFIQPSKRALSSMSPTIVLDKGITGREYVVHAVSGASGGSHIITAVVQVILDVLSFGMSPEAAVATKRFHSQLIPQVIYLENGFPQPAMHILSDIYSGVDNISISDAGSAANAILTRRREVWAGSDPRKGGAPAFQTSKLRVFE